MSATINARRAPRYAVLATTLGVVAAACAPVMPRPSEPLRETKLEFSASEFELSNGLKIAVLPSSGPQLISLTMHMAVGAIDDPSDMPGLAHVVEHMMFAQPLRATTVANELSRLTISYNAETRLDATDYVSSFLPTALPEVLAVEAARFAVRCREIPDAAFRHERDAVLNELEQKSAGISIADTFASNLFAVGHPYHRSIASTAKSIATLEQNRVCEFAERYYSTRRATLVISGPVTEAQVKAALAPLSAVVARAVADRSVLQRFNDGPTAANVTASNLLSSRNPIAMPLENPVALLAWPLPKNPADRARASAVARMIATRVGYACAEIGAGTVNLRIGGENASYFAIAISGDKLKLDALLKAARKGVEDTESWVAAFGFEQARERELTSVQQRFESTDDRIALALRSLDGGSSPATGYYLEIGALGNLTLEQANSLAELDFSWAAARILQLVPQAGDVAVATSELGTISALHDTARNDATDAKLADSPLTMPTTRTAFEPVQRTLPNGLNVLLVPHGEAPVVHLAMVFAAGAASEGITHRGVASAAADQLSSYRTFDALQFIRTGGSMGGGTTNDASFFVVTGLAAFIDIQLQSLQALVVEGGYSDDEIAKYRRTLARPASVPTQRAEQTSRLIWTALYGEQHPYVTNGTWRSADPKAISKDRLEEFRRRFYAPQNATLIITGDFDPSLANKWIDYIFADWRGPAIVAQAGAVPAKTPTNATALALAADATQIELTIAYPSRNDQNLAPQQLVIAEMINLASEGARSELGASYGVNASFTQANQGGRYLVKGSIAPARSAEAVKLLRSRIASLGDGSAQSKRWFVEARRRVAARATTPFDSAAAVLDALTEAVVARHPVSSLPQQIERTAALTYQDVAAVIAVELVPTAEVLLIAGNKSTVTEIFVALGRTPTWIPGGKP